MDIWHYDRVTGELLGQGTADPNPVDEGEWLHPAFSTPTAPPERLEGCAVVFAGSAWTNAIDQRGKTWWKADAEDNTEPVLIDFIGDPSAKGFTNVEPPAPPAPPPPPIVVSARQIRQALSLLGLRVAVEAWVQASDQDTKDNWQFETLFPHVGGLLEAAAEELEWPPETLDEVFSLAKAL